MQGNHECGNAPIDGLMKGTIVLDKSAEAHGQKKLYH
jgi:hypothetical protein